MDFSLAENLLATSSADRLVKNACAKPTNRLSEAEWKAVVAEVDYQPPCSR